MAENSAISWTRHTWNPWVGCAKVSPACDGCYAEAMMDKRYGRVSWGAPGKGSGTRSRTSASTWSDPFRWQRQAEKGGDRPFVFCASLADIFDNQVDPQWRADAFEVMRKTPRLVYLLLTKRPQLIVKLADAAGGLPPNAAIGTTVEDQTRANINLPALKVAKVELTPLFTFGSFEPLLGPITIPPAFMPDWVITGGETDQGGHKARPTHPDWFRSLRDQAAMYGAAYHHKQNGEFLGGMAEDHGDGVWFTAASEEAHSRWIRERDDFNWFDKDQAPDGPMYVRVGKKHSGRKLDGVEHNAFPEVIR